MIYSQCNAAVIISLCFLSNADNATHYLVSLRITGEALERKKNVFSNSELQGETGLHLITPQNIRDQ